MLTCCSLPISSPGLTSSLLHTHVLLPPGLGEHLHLIGSAADLPLPPRPSVRVPQPHGDGGVEHLLQVLLRQRRALDVSDRAHFFRQRPGVLFQHRPLPPSGQLDQHLDVLPQVALCADQEDGGQGAAAADFGDPLLPDVLEGGGADHAEAEQQGVGSAVAEVAQLVEFVLVEIRQDLSLCITTNHHLSSSLQPISPLLLLLAFQKKSINTVYVRLM